MRSHTLTTMILIALIRTIQALVVDSFDLAQVTAMLESGQSR